MQLSLAVSNAFLVIDFAAILIMKKAMQKSV